MGDDEPESSLDLAAPETTSADLPNSIIDIHEPYKNLEDECHCDSDHCKELKLSKELDTILDPTTIFRSTLQLDKIWSLLVTTTNKASYIELLSEFKTESRCAIAWPPCCVGYRCRTCSKNLAMSLCADCFRDGDHEGHDYNMFKSSSGGACDCGYSIVEDKGHCKRHGKNSKAKRHGEPLPESLICIPQRSMPRLIHRLAIQLRRSHVDLLGETDIYLDCLNQIANSCAIMRSLMIDALVSEEVYSSQIKLLSNHNDKEVAKIVNEGLKKLKRERKGLAAFTQPKEWTSFSSFDINAFCDNLTSNCFVDELIFWIVVFEFPQKLVCFVLGFLMDDKYKEVLSRAFVRQYPRIVMTLAGAKSEPRTPRNLRDSYEQLSKRIFQISVQFYSDDNLTKLLCDEEYTLHTLIYCLRIAIEGSPSGSLRGVLKSNPLGIRKAQVVCCDNPIIRDRHLGSFTDDFNAILRTSDGAQRLISDTDLLVTWTRMLSYFQTMSPYKRELTEHTPYETGPHVSVFTIENDFCLAPLWTILTHLEKRPSLPLARSLLQAIHEQMLSWFKRMAIGPNTTLDPYHMSFHIPLHRMFSATLRYLIFNQLKTDQEVYDMLVEFQQDYDSKHPWSLEARQSPAFFRSVNDFFKMLIKHPLQALILYHETRSSMWTRNGLMTINQAVTYVHSAYCYSTIDLDMFLLRYSATKLNPNYFLRILMSRFHAWKWLSFKSNILMSNASNNVNQWRRFCILPEQIIQMVESSLLVIIQILTLSLHCDIDDREQTRQEMISIISVLDRSYSYLGDMLPNVEPNSTNENFASLLEELTNYKPAQHGTGGNLQQGCYTLKPHIWDEEYNPIQIQYRFYQKRDYQMSLERFFQHAKLNGKLEKRYLPSTLWPPLKIPRKVGNFGELDLNPIIECPTLIGLVYSIIYKNLYIVDVPDVIMAYTIHLLELALRKSIETNSRASVFQHPPHGQSEPQTNWSFNGRFCFKELTSRPSYFGSKGEAIIKGNTLYPKTNQEQEHRQDAENKYFPLVRHALDLAFDTTWFPFKGILDNCLVHIETVYSLSSKEFNILLSGEKNKDTQPATTSKTSEASTSVKSLTLSSWFDELDEDDPFFDEDDDEDDESTDSDSESEEDEEDDENDDDDNDYDQIPAMVRVMRASRAARLTGGVDLDMSDGELTELVRERFFSGEARNNQTEDDERRTQDRATNTGATWTPSEPNQSNPQASLNQPVFLPESIRSLVPEQRTLNNPQNWPTETNVRNQASSTLTQPSEHHAIQEAQQPARQTSGPIITESMSIENFVDDIEMVAEPNDSNPNTTNTAISLGSDQPSPSTSNQPASERGGDHTYSAMETSMEVESLPETHSSALSLVPFQHQRHHQQQPEQQQQQQEHQHEQSQQQQSQIYPENLVTERRAILASDPRPMLTGSSQPLALEAPSSSSSRRRAASASDEQPLSEVDIQARFTGFFQSRLDSRQSSRGFRQRQMARRGGFRGPVPPFAVHNPNAGRPTARNITIQLRDDNDAYVRPRQTARRSTAACTLLNRALSSRMQPEQRVKRAAKKDMLDHNESLLSLLLRLHAKYSQKARSYEFNDTRAQLNRESNRTRIGDGAHSVTVILDLICTLDQRMRVKLEQLQELIWPNKESEQKNQEDLKSAQGQNTKCNATKTILKTSIDSCVEQQQQQQPMDAFVDKVEAGTSSSTTTTNTTAAVLSSAERRRKAKEFQSRLMAQFASKQKAFIEKYEANVQLSAHGNIRGDSKLESRPSGSSADEEPINLSSKLNQEASELEPKEQKRQFAAQEIEKSSSSTVVVGDSDEVLSGGKSKKNFNQTSSASGASGGGDSFSELTNNTVPIFECCICGVEGPSDLANPLGQVVLLQSTSIYGHSHLRPKCQRKLPREESEQQQLKEETYAKFLEHRIDLLCEHFSESSWLDSINIGAEGGVHVQSCGHYLHIECHQSYIKSLDQEDRVRSRSDSDEFLCPVCRQLANSVLPILSDIEREPTTTTTVAAAAAAPHPSSTQLPHMMNIASLMSSSDLTSAPGASSSSSREIKEVKVVEKDLEAQIRLVGALLKRRLPPNPKELQSSAAFCSHLTKATGPQYRLIRSNASMHSLFLFLTSIARTNLECEIIVRSTGCNLNCGSSARRSCFQLLFHVLALNAQTLINDQWFTCDEIWSRLTDHIDEKNRLSIKPVNSEVPLLLRDTTAMLLQFLFAITNSLCNKANFTCLVQMLFNLTAIQATALVLSYVKSASLIKLLDKSTTTTTGGDCNLPNELPTTTCQLNDLHGLIQTVSSNLAPFLAQAKEEPLMNASVRNCWQLIENKNIRFEGNEMALLENRIKLVCLPFLRACAFIQHQLYNQDYPDLMIVNDDSLTDENTIDADFKTLTMSLNLLNTETTYTTSTTTTSKSDLISSIKWPSSSSKTRIAGQSLISSWSFELVRFGLEYSIAARSLLVCRSLAWHRPSLMLLPKNFDDIFMFYYRKKCSLCQQIPKDVAICLVCGASICFRVSCCKDRSRSRQVHSQHCGANTAVFLAVHTSSIVVIRGNRACVWGSVYLDAHEEEDNGLQRGKPLYLVQARYNLLEQQWLTHSFDHTCGKRWIYLQENQ